MMMTTFRNAVATLMMIAAPATAQDADRKPFFPAIAAPASAPVNAPETLTEMGERKPFFYGKEAAQDDVDLPKLAPGLARDRVHLVSAGPVLFASASSAQTFVFSLSSPAETVISVGYLTGPDNHEGHSGMRITLNGEIVGQERISAASNGRVEVIVPARLTTAGLNRVEVRVTQADASCGTGEGVWTRLRPEATYAEVPSGASTPLWIDPGPDGYVDLAVLRGAGEPKASAISAITAAMRVAHTLSKTKVRTSVVSDMAAVSGADLIVSTAPVSPGEHHDGVPVLSVQQLSDLVANQIENVKEITGGQTIKLREFGIVAQGWSEAQHSETILFRLPDDYLSRNHGRMRVKVSGSADGAMDPSASMEVFINDEMSSGAPIPADWGRDNTWSFRVPMQHARPGLNRMKIVMNTPMPNGANCSVGADDASRFALFGDTSVTFPEFAQARRLSISGLAESGVVSVVADPENDYAVSVAATLLTRTVRSVKDLPEIEISEMTPRLETRNALIISTGGPSEPTYVANFGIDNADVAKWRDAMSERMTDVLALDEAPGGTATDAWALERYAYRNIDREAVGGTSDIWRWFLENVRPAGVSLRGDDAAFAVARETDSGATHVLMAISDPRAWERVSETIGESVIFAWDARASHIEVDGNIRSYKDSGIPHMTVFSVSNLRLVFADFVSSTPFLFLMLIVIAAILLALSTRSTLAPKDE